MKATLEFNLEEPDEKNHHLLCVHAMDMAGVLWSTLFTDANEFRDSIEEGRITSLDDLVSVVYQRIWERLDECGILLEDWYA